MSKRCCILVVLGSLALFVSGLILGAVGFRAYQGSHKFDFSPMPLSEAEEYFANDPDPEMRNFVRQLSDPSRFDSLPPLVIQTYSDGTRFGIAHEKHRYTLVSELFEYKGDEMQINRTYGFKEGGANIRFTITRNAATNEIIDIVYSFSDDIFYVDKNGDGTWDIVKGASFPLPMVIQSTANENSDMGCIPHVADIDTFHPANPDARELHGNQCDMEQEQNCKVTIREKQRILLLNQDYQGALDLMPQVKEAMLEEAMLAREVFEKGMLAEDPVNMALRKIRYVYCYLYVAVGRDKEALQKIKEIELPIHDDTGMAFFDNQVKI